MCYLFILSSILITLSPLSSSAQNDCDTSLMGMQVASKNGVIINNNKYFKRFAVLIQDTCANANRFEDYILYPDKKTSSNRVMPAVIVDTNLMSVVETFINGNTDNFSNMQKYIRLYIGCINDKSDTCIIVQFLKLSEYRKNKEYCKQLNLIARQAKDLRFAIFAKEGSEIKLVNSFPKGLL